MTVNLVKTLGNGRTVVNFAFPDATREQVRHIAMNAWDTFDRYIDFGTTTYQVNISSLGGDVPIVGSPTASTASGAIGPNDNFGSTANPYRLNLGLYNNYRIGEETRFREIVYGSAVAVAIAAFWWAPWVIPGAIAVAVGVGEATISNYFYTEPGLSRLMTQQLGKMLGVGHVRSDITVNGYAAYTTLSKLGFDQYDASGNLTGSNIFTSTVPPRAAYTGGSLTLAEQGILWSLGYTMKGGSSSGSFGTDTIVGSDSHDAIKTYAGADTVDARGGDDFVDSGVGEGKTVRLGTGNDIFDGVEELSGNDIVYGDAGNDNIWGGWGLDTLYGGDGYDNISGENDADTIYGDAGDDYLYGQNGNDILYGGTGNDNVYGQAGNDYLEGGLGNDGLYGWDGDDTILGGDDADTIYGDTGDDRLYGGTGNDNVYGQAGNDYLEGGMGNDSLYGGDGNDVIDEDGPGVMLLGLGYGNDTIDAGAGDDTVWAGDGNDVVIGGTGNDTLNGEFGDDVISGGLGNDRLYGGGGNDQFVFATTLRSAVGPFYTRFGESDIIYDFYRFFKAPPLMGDTIVLDRGDTYELMQSGNNTMIATSSGLTITLMDFNVDQWSSSAVLYA
ncbi:MAG: calcium-binding protein [Gammaproteobacteria bacterium]|nr:calcium-binding protein [Gammaproteobacteria bacterium]